LDEIDSGRSHVLRVATQRTCILWRRHIDEVPLLPIPTIARRNGHK
jgi:hypothetical protein